MKASTRLWGSARLAADDSASPAAGDDEQAYAAAASAAAAAAAPSSSTDFDYDPFSDAPTADGQFLPPPGPTRREADPGAEEGQPKPSSPLTADGQFLPSPSSSHTVLVLGAAEGQPKPSLPTAHDDHCTSAASSSREQSTQSTTADGQFPAALLWVLALRRASLSPPRPSLSLSEPRLPPTALLC